MEKIKKDMSSGGAHLSKVVGGLLVFLMCIGDSSAAQKRTGGRNVHTQQRVDARDTAAQESREKASSRSQSPHHSKSPRRSESAGDLHRLERQGDAEGGPATTSGSSRKKWDRESDVQLKREEGQEDEHQEGDSGELSVDREEDGRGEGALGGGEEAPSGDVNDKDEAETSEGHGEGGREEQHGGIGEEREDHHREDVELLHQLHAMPAGLGAGKQQVDELSEPDRVDLDRAGHKKRNAFEDGMGDEHKGHGTEVDSQPGKDEKEKEKGDAGDLNNSGGTGQREDKKMKKDELAQAGSSGFVRMLAGSLSAGFGYVAAVVGDEYGGLPGLVGAVVTPVTVLGLEKTGKISLSDLQKASAYGALVGAGVHAGSKVAPHISTLSLSRVSLPTFMSSKN